MSRDGRLLADLLLRRNHVVPIVPRKCCVCIGSGFRYFRDEQGTGYCECQNCKGTGEEPEEEKEEVA